MSNARWMRIKQAVDRAFNPGDEGRSRVNALIVLVITINVVAVVLETHVPIAREHQSLLDLVEVFSSVVFGIEYVLRLWVADLGNAADRPNVQRVRGKRRGWFVGGQRAVADGGPSSWRKRIRYALTPLALIDLMAILPALVPMFIPVEASVLRVLRMLRFVRILKIGRYGKAMRLVAGALGRKKEELALTLFFLVVLLILASTVIYLAEREAQPQHFGSIPMSMWWAIVTLTTLGYGDIVPITELGRVLAGVVAVSGVIFVALPAGIVSSGFFEQLREQGAGANDRRDGHPPGQCPHCARSLAEPPSDG